MITLAHLSTVAVLLITVGAFFIHRSAINRARSYKLGREEGMGEAARGQSELHRLAVAMSGPAGSPAVRPGSHIKPTMSDLMKQLEARARFLSGSELDAFAELASLKSSSRAVTPPVIPQSSPPYSKEDNPRGPHIEKTKG